VSDAVLTPQASKVKVRFVCPQDYKNRFAESHCLLGISVGQSKHEGQKLLSTLAKINESFGKCTIMLADTLQRFNLRTNHPSLSWSELTQMTKQAGDDWLIRNAEILQTLTMPYEISRWDYWRAHPKFEFAKQLIEILAEENKSFRTAIFETISELALRFDKNQKLVNNINLFKYSAEYVKEECAVQLLMADENYDFVAYPGIRNNAMDKIYNFLVLPEHPNKFNWIDIKINC
jgi:hypothetical protein